jgi:hypothetical protein
MVLIYTSGYIQQNNVLVASTNTPNAAIVNSWYQSVIGRPAENPSWQVWIRALDDGIPQNEVYQEFLQAANVEIARHGRVSAVLTFCEYQPLPPPPAPTPAPAITGSFTGPTAVVSLNTTLDQVDLRVEGPGPGIYNYSITGNPAVSFDTHSGNPPTGVFNWSASGPSNRRAAVNLTTPHPATVLTAIISGEGYTPYTAQLSVPAREPGERVFGAGTHEFVVPVYSSRLEILLIGPGGGGGTSNPKTTGGNGTTSVVQPLGLQANGGQGGTGTGDHGLGRVPGEPRGGSASGGSQNTTGNGGNQTGAGSGKQVQGGTAGFTAAGTISAPATTGQGGISGGTFKGSSWSYCTSGAGGGSVYKSYGAGELAPGTTLSVSVGSGGAAGGSSGGAASGAGVDGICWIKWN